ncbi:hypothetical protein AZE42_03420 [Rhizopogon vesiculosus]|uniref:EF-hand domain-containing protein n=2 Tax=Rhizopogon TaxID=5375 RepID=A0A1J8QEG9_9AGAM|nr:hypothetical protein AZE42_03420 [Rhizopogon vesiculosus]
MASSVTDGETDPLADALPPRYAIESDDEDEYNPLSTRQPADAVSIVHVIIEGQFTTGHPLVIASGPAGKFWADGANLGEQQGTILVNNIQVGSLFKPSSTRAVVLVSEATTALPLWSMNKYANGILDHLRPSAISILDMYAVQNYISSALVPVHEVSVRYLSLGNIFLDPFHPFAPPNILQCTAAAFMSAMNIRTLSSDQGNGGVILLLPSPEIPRTVPSKLSPSGLSRSSGDQGWPVEMMMEVNERLFEVVGAKPLSTWTLGSMPSGGAYDLSKTKRSLAEVEYKEAFALFDKKGTGSVPRETLGDLLRALGQNPTQAEVTEIITSAPREVDYKTFLTILNRPDGFKPAGTPEEFIRGFQVFDKEGNGFIGAGELRYVLTQLGEKMSDEEVDELLKGVQIGPDGNVNYESFVRTILSQ